MKNQATKNANHAPYLSLIMGSALAISPTTAMGQTPPPLINGLPPAPPPPGNNDNQIDFDATPLPPVPNVIHNSTPKTPVSTITLPPSQPPVNIPVTVNNSAPRQTNLSGKGWYRVDVVGDNPMLLAQVQRLEPKAFIRSGEGVIQAGIFSDEVNAQKLRKSLDKQGLRSQIVSMSSTVNKPSSTFNLPTRYPKKKGYFVVIPADSQKLAKIVDQVLDSGVDKTSVSLQDYPLGNHVGIGPFSRRTEAQRWNAHFRSLGMDARLYFGR
jgi:hypothetical protein